MPRLHIYDPRERALVGAADRVLSMAAAAARPFRRRHAPAHPRRILLLRLERIGDLLMALPGIADVRALAPDAEIDLVVGRWNREIAEATVRLKPDATEKAGVRLKPDATEEAGVRLKPDATEKATVGLKPDATGGFAGITRVIVLDAAWLAREGGGLGAPALIQAARQWRSRHYDLAMNFEPDVRSNLLLAASGAAWTAGYASGGGGPLLDLALEYDVRAHTTDNARRLVRETFGRTPEPTAAPILALPDDAVRAARNAIGHTARPRVGVHVSGGRAIKQWPPERFAEVARRLIERTHATIVLTGSPGDRPLVDTVKRLLPQPHVIDAAGDANLIEVAALLRELDLLITGDTGPMHLATTVGTPIVAVFGPSDPARYAPRGPHDRVVRVDLPCAPCNRIRLPPARCTGHTPDCLAFVTADAVLAAALSVLEASQPVRTPAPTSP